MFYAILADTIVVLHTCFVLFAMLGGLLVFRWKCLIWFHVPSVIWGVIVELNHWVCPLTPIENALRQKAGLEAYEGSFVENYLIPILYPQHLTESLQTMLAIILLLLNLGIYLVVFRKK